MSGQKMDAFHTPICSFQGGSNYQRMQHNYVLPGIRPSHQSYSLMQNVSQSAPLIIPTSYQLSNSNGNNQVNLGLNGPVKILPCLNPATNFMPFIVNNGNNISYNCHGGLFPTENSQSSPVSIIPQNQTSQIQKIKAQTSTDKSSGVINDKIENINKKARKGDNNGKRTKETNASNQAIDAREKMGNIVMDIIPVIPIHNIPVKQILDLNFMGCLFEIKNLNVDLHARVTCKMKFLDVLKQVINNKILLYWLILKCEERQISVFQLNVCMELYSVDDFQALYETIAEESCLPLPFITKGVGDKKKYFYLNLTKGNNVKIKKLNAPIFFDVNENKKIMCKYPGIKLHCTFSENVKDFTIYIHESAMSAYQSSSVYIREVIIYKHIVWGFLQAWIRRVKKHHKDFFTAEQISKNLSLQQMKIQNGKIPPQSENLPIYFIGYQYLYLKFNPVNSKKARDSFSVENFETKFVCDVTLVQYYRQFFLLNDKHFVDLLNCVVLFFGRKLVRPKLQNEKDLSRNKLLQKGEKHFIVSSTPEKTQIVSSQCQGFRIDVLSSSSDASISGIRTNKKEETSGIYFSWHTSESAENSVNNEDNVKSTKPKEQTIVCTPEIPLVRPLLKTRTVEEINSSIEANKRLGFYPINFDSVGKLDVKTDTRDQLKQQEVATLVQEALQNSYLMNSLEITKLDEIDDENVISKRFKEALKKAMGSKSLESFIDTIYINLQLHFTNSTSQKILNTMIERAMEEKYPGFKNIFTGSQSVNQTLIDKPSTEYQPQLLGMVKKALAPENTCLNLTQQTTMESGKSCVLLNSPAQISLKKEDLQNLSQEEVFLKEQTNKMNVEISVSKPSENVQSNNRTDILSEDKESSNTETCSLFKKEKNIEGAGTTPLGKKVLSSSKDDNSNISNNNVELKSKTEGLDFLKNNDSAGKAAEKGSISTGREGTKSSDSKNTGLECKPKLNAQENETSQPDSNHRSVKLNVQNIRNFNRNCNEEERDIQNKTGVLDSLQLSHDMKKHVIVETTREPKKKKRKWNDSDEENSEIRARALERLRKRSNLLKVVPVKNITKGKPNETNIARNSGKKLGDYEDRKENDFFGGNRFKKELKILLKRLEDMPEYKKYVENCPPNLQSYMKKVEFTNKNSPESFCPE